MVDYGFGFIFLIIASFAYFLPSIIAARRGHHNRNAICVLNLLAGWTAIGWVIAIVWASTEVHQVSTPEVPMPTAPRETPPTPTTKLAFNELVTLTFVITVAGLIGFGVLITQLGY